MIAKYNLGIKLTKGFQFMLALCFFKGCFFAAASVQMRPFAAYANCYTKQSHYVRLCNREN